MQAVKLLVLPLMLGPLWSPRPPEADTPALPFADDAHEVELVEGLLPELEPHELEGRLLDLELGILALARLDREQELEHLLRVSGALRWRAREELGLDLEPSALEPSERMAWLAWGLRRGGPNEKAEQVSRSALAALMDLVGREDARSHWLRGQRSSGAELVTLWGSAESEPFVEDHPRLLALLRSFQATNIDVLFRRLESPQPWSAELGPAARKELAARIDELARLLAHLRLELVRGGGN